MVFRQTDVSNKQKKWNDMEDIIRIKIAIEILKDNHTFKVGELVLYH